MTSLTEQEQKDFVTSIKKELIEEENIFLTEEFADDTSNFMVNALEKQIPKKVYKWANGDTHCPNEECDCNVNGWYSDDYCHNCGQKLDWSEV